MSLSNTIEVFKTNPRRALAALMAMAMGLFHLYTSGIRPLPAIQQRVVHLSFALILTFLMFPLRPSEEHPEGTPDESRPLNLLDMVCVFLSAAMGIYVLQQYDSIIFRLADPVFLDSAISLVAILLVLEATRRVMGLSVIIICLLCFAYLAVGQYLPSFLGHPGFTLERVVNFMFLTTEGIMGTALGVSATVIAAFILFSAFLNESGAGPLFTEAAYSLFGKYRGGPAKAAVAGSTLFGMITGSQTANVSAVGVFTIPLMKKVGYKPEMAGAIEAVASTGAMIMPPVMGAAAFIIPEILGCKYWDVVKANFIPALLYYAALYVYVEVQSVRLGILGVPRSELPSIKNLLKERMHMIVPVLVLIYFLAIEMASATRAAFWAIVAAVFMSQFRKNTRMTVKNVGVALEQGMKGSIVVANACASAGIITGAIALSGMGLRFSDILITIAGGSLIVLLLLTMVASLIIGLPLPPVSSYLVLAVLAVPAMVKLGVHPMAAHLFVFFFGTMGNISPPVAPTSFAAAGIAGSNPFKTTNLAFLISFPSYLVPFLFVYSPQLMLYGSTGAIIITVITAFLGVGCMAVAMQGWFFKQLSWLWRIFVFATGLLLAVPEAVTDLIGFLMLVIFVISQLVQKRVIAENSNRD
ncbi:MAG: Sialic acid TRAP transporter permease protein SiaT [Syntrophorhabdus sp. PtaU1.Bin050]|nr:MAG: Sialic acid TRAP transporter permease protein SiaT [Syntrophorhabdus sp. PtaU1.Bin050]